MAGSSIKIDGLQQVGAAMKELGLDIALRISRSAVNAGAQVIKKAAIQNAPSDTGNLKKNIIVKRVPPRETKLTEEYLVTVRSGKITKKQKGRGLVDAYYGRFVEFGTVNQPPEPFMRPAFDQNKEFAARAITDKLRDRVNKGK